ncbi:YceI family protein [Pseudonocardia sp. TRM90224]|uniref:YceI family protein n=1 Tax=Pseudonocardia sp. TRM90224 TaxID=2812678 RepID=UPI001E3957C3|nr:YceI family protein [Pseudonocardia sp. TRM90224]
MTATAPAFVGTFTADPAHSSVTFAVRHMKVSVFRAFFGEVHARVVADAAGVRLEGGALVESLSIRSPKEFREHVVNGSDFFDAEHHPELTVRSSDVRIADDGSVAVQAELTIKGVTRPVTARGTYQPPVEDPYGVERAAIELTAEVDRREWGMGWQAPMPGGGDVLAYDVQLSAHLELVRES